jgi:hypothetical protein
VVTKFLNFVQMLGLLCHTRTSAELPRTKTGLLIRAVSTRKRNLAFRKQCFYPLHTGTVLTCGSWPPINSLMFPNILSSLSSISFYYSSFYMGHCVYTVPREPRALTSTLGWIHHQIFVSFYFRVSHFLSAPPWSRYPFNFLRTLA